MAGNSKNVLLPLHFLAAQSMGASFISPVIDPRFLDNFQIVLSWTGGGAPVGTFTLQTSSDYQPGGTPTAAPVIAGTWVPMPLSASIAAAGVADQALIDVNQAPGPWLRLIYTRTSGTAALDGYVSGKAV